MATDTQSATEIPGGTWAVDPVHSVAGFSVRHMMVGTFRGEFKDIDATLTDGKLVGKVKVGSLEIKDERLLGLCSRRTSSTLSATRRSSMSPRR